jgi:hypothetical protein
MLDGQGTTGHHGTVPRGLCPSGYQMMHGQPLQALPGHYCQCDGS